PLPCAVRSAHAGVAARAADDRALQVASAAGRDAEDRTVREVEGVMLERFERERPCPERRRSRDVHPVELPDLASVRTAQQFAVDVDAFAGAEAPTDTPVARVCL